MTVPANIEAKSLSSLNHLAAHPPQYPINPIERHETLTLYISRVPGSRDIILSPFKPQRNNVMGDDVSNSLYYIHLDTPGDERLAPKCKDDVAPRSSLESSRTIKRKPLPASAKVPHLQNQASSEMPDASNLNSNSNDAPRVQCTSLSQPAQNKENIPMGADISPASQSVDAAQMPAPPPPAKVPVAHTGIPRKALGPRPMGSRPPSMEISHLTPLPGVVRPATPPTPDETRSTLSARPQPPPLCLDEPPRLLNDIRTTHSPVLQSPLSPSRSPSPWKKQKPFTPFTPFALTIIRRDPGTGHQWNIGKVSSFQSTILTQEPNNPDAPQVAQYPRGYPEISIHIETSGYARFRNFPTALPPMNISADGRPGSAGSTARSMKELAANMMAAGQDAVMKDTEEGFSRQVAMTYGKTWTHNLKEAFSKRRERSSTTTSANSNPDMEPLDPPRAGFHKRQDSGNSTNSNDSTFLSSPLNPNNLNHNRDDASPAETPASQHMNPIAAAAAKPDEPQPILTQPGPGLKPKGYTFTSPWDGRCDFRTSSSGRALKCRHVRNTQSQGFNPLVAAQALRDAAVTASSNEGGRTRGRTRGMSGSLANAAGAAGMGGGDLSKTVPVSELRFNLPNSDLFNSKEDRERAAHELKEGLSRLLVHNSGEHKRSDGSDEEDGDELIFDFSGLGREKAGGGSRGKKAKLGKLLVHDEGLKMLDLVVAANMGIWWQAWERSF